MSQNQNSQKKTFLQSSLNSLQPGAHVHLMGICGTAMASLAGLLNDRGFKVSGSDSNPYPPMSTQIESLGIKISKPYQKENLVPKPDFVVVGNVISAGNPEVEESMQLGIPFCSLPKAMGEFIIGERDSYVIAGTHGKTTTTSLLAWIAECLELNPGFLIGGIPKNFSQSFKNPKGNLFVIEGDEYDTAYFDKVPKFVHYRPKYATLTSVEFDHADIYADFDAVKAAFKTLAALIPADGRLVYWGDDRNVTAIASQSKCPRFSYGFESSCDYVAKILEEKEHFTKFKIEHKGEVLIECQTPMVGRYNILNAASCVVQAYLSGWNIQGVKKALSTFTGVKRRQDVLGQFGGVEIVEDFAHHPTAVKETVVAIQNKYQGRKVFSVFEPRSATSRRKVFQKDYVAAFSEAQESILAEAFDQGKIAEDNRFSSAELIRELKAKGKSAFCYSTVDEIVGHLDRHAKKGDVILVMSNGGFGGIYQKLMDTLSKRN